MLEVRNLTIKSRRETILKAITFRAQPGEISAIVGPSGAGKSTLLKAMTGDQSYDGAITLQGHDVAHTSLAEMARLRAVLPQSTPLAFPYTVIEVVRMGLVNAPGEHRIAFDALARVGLDGFAGRFYQELSGGEQQRVQLARVLVQVWRPVRSDSTPCWLFLDEPVSSLDIGHQLQVMELLRDFSTQGGGVVMVMHDLNLTAMCADKVALLSEGDIMKQGTANEVLTNEHLSKAYGCGVLVNRTPKDCTFVLPQVASRS